MKAQIKSWQEKRKQAQHEQELRNRRETIMYNLLNDLTTEESLNMFKDIKSLFFNNVENRFNSISEEKRVIELFLEK